MSSVRRGNAVGKPNDRSALEFIYMKPWRKSYLSKEFLSTSVHESQFSSGHSIFDSLPISQTGDCVSTKDEDEGSAISILDEPAFWVRDEILDDETRGESSSTDSDDTFLSEVQDEEKSIDMFAKVYARELQLPSNFPTFKPQTQRVTLATIPVKPNKTLTTGKSSLNEDLLSLVFEDEEFTCPECLKAFPREGLLEKHKMLMHDESRRFVCAVCEKRYTDSNNLKVHKYKMHGPGQYKCKRNEESRGKA